MIYTDLVRIGIDPGLGGAIAIISDNEIKFHDMPIMKIPWAVTSKYKHMVDVESVYETINSYANIESVKIEIVGVRPNQGALSNSVLVAAMYSVMNTVKLCGIDPEMIHPGKWKKRWGLIGMDKDASRLVVLKMYPHLLPQLKRKKDVDRAEALLIAAS